MPTESPLQIELIEFLKNDLAIPDNEIAVALRHQEHNTSFLPMILWQYGLVTLAQLDQIFDWLEGIQS